MHVLETPATVWWPCRATIPDTPPRVHEFEAQYPLMPVPKAHRVLKHLDPAGALDAIVQDWRGITGRGEPIPYTAAGRRVAFSSPLSAILYQTLIVGFTEAIVLEGARLGNSARPLVTGRPGAKTITPTRTPPHWPAWPRKTAPHCWPHWPHAVRRPPNLPAPRACGNATG